MAFKLSAVSTFSRESTPSSQAFAQSSQKVQPFCLKVNVGIPSSAIKMIFSSQEATQLLLSYRMVVEPRGETPL